ncbi:ATP-binding protein [Virgisporangium aliadipatigenens]|uniref:ATP-binding protein n=1 Tax=Virgisporangium aliadipatigenens TaxID=741659 RepID=UPI0019432EDB|nr:ATP-binding protein [Virgisporangium aliadipatigenens]
MGRQAEVDLFRAALAGGPHAVLHLHGPAGVGKSALLQRFADEATDSGRTVVHVDGRAAATPGEFQAQAQAATVDERAVLLVDSFERCRSLEQWLARQFLPRVPVGVVVVLAGREPLDPRCWSDLGWTETLRVVPVGNLSTGDARALLRAWRVPGAAHEAILSFTRGHPLALRLSAHAAPDETASIWQPPRDVVRALLAQLVGPLPSLAHRAALEACAHALVTTEDLLRAMCARDAADLFDWLRRLPFVTAGSHGLVADPLVREIVSADLRWRDPRGHADLRRRLRELTAARVLEVPDEDVLPAVAALYHLDDGMPTGAALERVVESAFRPTDDLTPLGGTTASRVYRSQGRLVAYLSQQSLASQPESDPLLTTAWEHSRRNRPLRPGEHLTVSRFAVHPDADRAVTDLVLLRITADWVRSEGLAWSYTALPDTDAWAPLMARLDQHPIRDIVTIAGRRYRMYAHDWRAVPHHVWFDPAQRPGPQAALAVLSQEEFDAAVRAALRRWHSPTELAANPLAGSRLVAARPEREPAAAVKAVVADALAALRADPRHARLYEVLAVTFLHGVPPTQELAARRLNVSFSTYRRHLAAGTAAVVETLWQAELSG